MTLMVSSKIVQVIRNIIGTVCRSVISNPVSVPTCLELVQVVLNQWCENKPCYMTIGSNKIYIF